MFSPNWPAAVPGVVAADIATAAAAAAMRATSVVALAAMRATAVVAVAAMGAAGAGAAAWGASAAGAPDAGVAARGASAADAPVAGVAYCELDHRRGACLIACLAGLAHGLHLQPRFSRCPHGQRLARGLRHSSALDPTGISPPEQAHFLGL